MAIEHPGITLQKCFLQPAGISAVDLASGLNVEVGAIEKVLLGEAPITVSFAVRLGLFFDVPAAWWVDMQARYDLNVFQTTHDLRSAVKPYNGLSDLLVTPAGIKRFATDHAPSSPAVEMFKVSPDVLERLRAQVRLQGPRERRRDTEVVQYENGMSALVGKPE